MSVKGGKILSKIEKNVEELINPIVTNWDINFMMSFTKKKQKTII